MNSYIFQIIDIKIGINVSHPAEFEVEIGKFSITRLAAGGVAAILQRAAAVLHCTVHYCTVHYSTVHYCTVHTVLYITVMYCTILL